MSHFVFATPAVSGFHLLERARRELARRGHRVSLLCADDATGTFWSAQMGDVERLEPTPRQTWAGPTNVAGDATRADAARADARRGGARLRDAAAGWIDGARPDLVLFHGRHDAQAAIQDAARDAGCRTLWTGEGLLPHTLQIDPSGLDADASSQRWTARDFRVVSPDEGLLRASLADAFAGQTPLGLPRAPVLPPRPLRRIADAARAASAGDVAGAWRAWTEWRAALPPARTALPSREDAPPPPPATPFVAVLLQPHRGPRSAQAGVSAEATRALLRRSLAIAADLDAQTVAILPPGSDGARWRRALSGTEFSGLLQLPAHAAAVAAATAAVTVTVNHPAAVVALLAGTPVVHTGRALYHLDGVTHQTRLSDLGAAASTALRRDRPALRRRFLTWLLRYGHVWCSPTEPTYNGLLGLVERIERQADAPSTASEPCHQYGPGWPLTASV